ncbi:MAG: hypothetical protein KDC87_21440, partial [Planctomycetes bacterium]|nr:hypothetical protein [Planctomycetota bacterium]
MARGLLGWVAVAVWLLATSLAAQDPLLSAALGEKDVSAERVKSRLEALTKDSQLDKGARQELESAYRGALAEAEAADRLRQQLAQKRALGADGVAQIERVRRPLPPARDPATLGLLQLEELESRLKVARAAVDAAANAVRQAEAQVADLAARQKELPKRIAAGEKRIRELEEALRIAAAVETDALRKTAGQTLAACRLAAARLDHAVAQAELQTFSLANELAGAKLERARAEQQRAAAWVAEIGKVLQVRLQEDVNQEIDRAARQMREVESGNPVLREALRDNLERARLRRDVQVELPGLRQRVQEVQKTLADSRQRFAAIRKMITQIGLTQTTGEMLRQQRARLPDPATHQRQRAKLQEQSNGIRLKQMLLAEELAIDVERFVDRVRQAEPEAARAQIEPLARTVHADRQEILGKLQRDYDEQLNELARLESEELVLQQFAGEFSGFIDEKILWVRSSVPIWQSDFRRLPKVLDEMGPLLRFPEAAVRGARDSVVELGLMGILLLGLIGLRPRLLRGLKTCAEQVKRPLDTSMHPTTLAVLLTAALAAPPAVLLWMVNEVVRSYEVVQVVGVGMARATAGAVWLAWPLEFFRQACRTNGLAREQFGWPPAAVSRLSRALLLLGMVGVPVLLLVRSLDSAPEHVRSLVSRPVLALAWLLMALLLGSLLRPDSGLLGAAAAPERRMARRTRVIIMAALVCASLAVVVLALTGWFFTARHLSARLLSTLG